MKPPAIPLEQITPLPKLMSQVIPPEYRDENNHMNVRWYLSIFDEAGYFMIDLLGMNMAYHAEHGTGGFDLEHHIYYVNEVHIGDEVVIYWRLLARTAKRMHYVMFMVNETRGTLSAIFECVNSFADLTVRKTAPYPPDIAANLDKFLAEHTALPWVAPTCGSMSA